MLLKIKVKIYDVETYRQKWLAKRTLKIIIQQKTAQIIWTVLYLINKPKSDKKLFVIVDTWATTD